MRASKNCVVAIQYILTNDKGEQIDASSEGKPLRYLHGAGNIIPGLENGLEDAQVGEQKQITVQPVQGYGEFDESLIQTLPREMFTGVDEIERGMEFQMKTPEGHEHFVVVTKVDEEGVTVDGNHPLAGAVLHFDVTIESIREATEEEREHGHVH